MIIVRMQGGLGNQMFQHAAGTALARHHDCALRWDLSCFESSQAHQGFELQRVFGLDTPEATEADFCHVLGWRGHLPIKTLLARRRLAWVRPKSYVTQPHFHYWTGFLSSPTDAYLDGYWQSEKYFTTMEQSIRDAFTFAHPLSERNRELANRIASCNAVSLHVRRGDYVTNSATNQIHGCCTPEYYQNAIKFVLDRLNAPHFFVFSDDPEWVRSNLSVPTNCTYVDHNSAAESYNDMRLMSLCKHHVIANSSFSWWGAWISGIREGLVVAPKRWFLNYSADTSDLYCQDWMLL